MAEAPLHHALKGRRVLVTGGSGFIGSHLVERLVLEGAEVHAVSRVERKKDQGVCWSTGDVGEIGTVRRLFKEVRPQIVFHLASHVMGSPSLEHALPTFRANLQSSVNILNAAAEEGCERLILTGSLAEFEVERGEAFPSSPYAASKSAASSYGRMFHALYHVPVTIARVFMVYGPRQQDVTKLVPSVTLSLLRGGSPEITSGTRLIDWIFVSDVVEGFVGLATHTGVDGITVELGSGQLITIREIVEAIERAVGRPGCSRFGALPDRPLEPVRTADIETSRRRIGWAPRINLTSGIRLTVDWYKEHLNEYPLRG